MSEQARSWRVWGGTPACTRRQCLACRNFRNDGAAFAAALPGLASFGSADASVSGDDGLCVIYDRFVTARSTCEDFAAR